MCFWGVGLSPLREMQFTHKQPDEFTEKADRNIKGSFGAVELYTYTEYANCEAWQFRY